MTTNESSAPQDPEDILVDSIFNLSSVIMSSSELMLVVNVEGEMLEMEVDTGSTVAMISTADHKRVLQHIPLNPTSRCFHVYAGAKLEPVGEIWTNVTFSNRTERLPLVVVNAERYAPPLLGRNWLDVLIPNQREMFTTSSESQFAVAETTIDDLKAKYADVFAPGLGTVKGVKATLHLKDDTRPIFCKARPVPFALHEAVDAELDRMQAENIITPVDTSEWATPLVCVPKTDGSVRLCGDYKITVNRCIHTDQHPIPTPDEVLAKIAGGQKFTKIDL